MLKSKIRERMKDKPVILVVDDEPQNIELLEAYLAPLDYEIVTAANGEKALGKLSDNQIDLILLDVIMPGMDGFEVTRRVRQDNTHRLLPIILITVLWEKEDRVKGIEAGCDDFLSKPVDKMELLARVRSLLKVKAYNDLLSNYRNELESEVIKRTEELKRALEKLRESERRYREFFSTSRDCVFISSMEGKWIDFNEIALEMFRYDSREELSQVSIYSLYENQEERSLFLALIEKQGYVKEHPVRLRRKDGAVIDALITSGFLRNTDGFEKEYYGTIRDITERKRVEEELRESENKYRLLADNVRDVIFVLDMNLNYTYISPSIKILWGYEPAEVLKQKSFETLTPSSWELAVRTLSEVMELEKSEHRDINITRTLPLEEIRKDGSTIWTEVKFSFIRDENQRPVGILGVPVILPNASGPMRRCGIAKSSIVWS
jgi:PAS domain S-box-containing protein